MNRIIEGTMTNVFLVQKGVLATPDVCRAGVAGVMRGLIMDMAKQSGITCAVRDIPLQALSQADEVFVCNSLIGLWPVRCVDQWVFETGPVTGRIAQSIRGT